MAAASRGRTRCATAMAMPAMRASCWPRSIESIDTRLLVTDGVFSMDGDLAPLPELARSARAKPAPG